jgi:hypothetical protein
MTVAATVSMLDEALRLARSGLPVFPVSPRTKKPMTEHGFYDATTNPIQIEDWWARSPSAMIGVRTGVASGLAVLDLDIKADPNTGRVLIDGNARLHEVMALHGWQLPDTMEVQTPSGGRHLYFKHEPGFTKSKSHKDVGIDYRCESGYIIFPPSIRVDGARYSFANPYPLFAPEKAPDWLAEFFRTDHLPGLIEPKVRLDYTSNDRIDLVSSTSTSRPEDIERALYSAWDSDSFDDWTTAALALHGIPEGREMWLGWAATSPKFDRAENERKWTQTRPSRGITARTILSRVPRSALADWAREHRGDTLDDLLARARASEPVKSPASRPMEQPRPRVEVMSVGDLRKLPPAQWIIERQMFEDGWGYIWGAPGCGKSFVALDQALHVAYARPSWHFGAKVNVSGPVLYILQEGVRSFAKRIDAWKAHHKINDDPGQLRLIRQRLNFMESGDVALLVEAIKAEDRPFKMIVLDTLSRVIPGADENAQDEMSLFVEASERVREVTGATLLGVHHANKSGESERGSTVLRGAADFVFRLDKGAGESRIKMTCTKLKDEEDGWHREFDLARVETFSPFGASASLVVTEAAPETAPDQVALDHVMRALIERGPLNQTEVKAIVRERFVMAEHPTRALIEGWVDARRLATVDGGTWRIEARQGGRNQLLIAAVRAE